MTPVCKQVAHTTHTLLSLSSDGPGAAETVETHLFAALRATRLVGETASWAECGYSRCGRTDRGVSALDQVIAATLRSSGDPEAELDYVGCLNRQLPDDIRVLSWAPAPVSSPPFSARFSASYRQYKYFFWDDGGFDLDAMRLAASKLVGEHDFRNVCKMDVDAVSNFRRTILEFTVDTESNCLHGQPLPGRLCSLNVRGTAFLWHQVRCMASLLFLVGRRLEEPSVIDALLDVERNSGKPAYDMAPEEALLFFAAGYATPGLGPEHLGATPHRTRQLLVDHLAAQTRRAEVRARVWGYALQAAQRLLQQQGPGEAVPACQPRHVPLLQRKREATYEEQLARRPPGKVKAFRSREDAQAQGGGE